MSPTPRKPTTRGLPPRLYKDRRHYRYRHPETGKLIGMGADREAAIAAARELNAYYAKSESPTLIARGLGTADKTVAQVIELYTAKALPHKAWDAGTRANNVYKLGVYRRAFGARAIRHTDRLFLAEWLETNTASNDAYNKHRERLVDLYEFAIGRGYIEYNEAAATLKRSLSKKLPANRKVRQRLDLAGYYAIREHASCPRWLAVAMDLSFVTLQSRREIVAMKYAHVRGGRLHVIRDKTSGDSDMAFISIELAPMLAALIKRSREDFLSHYIVHYKPVSRRRSAMNAKDDWTQVAEGYLTKTFQSVRDACGAFDALAPRARPTFHEIRSLGGRTYLAQGFSRAYIKYLMTHTNERTTQLYLSGEPLRDDHFVPVKAELDLRRLKPGDDEAPGDPLAGGPGGHNP